jgi:hypothetical protein
MCLRRGFQPGGVPVEPPPQMRNEKENHNFALNVNALFDEVKDKKKPGGASFDGLRSFTPACGCFYTNRVARQTFGVIAV